MAEIAVAGLGYVGLSLAVLLGKHHAVVGVDLDEERVAQLRAGRCPVRDPELEDHLAYHQLDLAFTTDPAAYSGVDLVIVATPTDYDPDTDAFRTDSVEQVVAEVLERNATATVVVKSTVPVGFTDRLRQRFETDRILFSPEFLREGRALRDNLHPSRIVVGDRSERGRAFADLLVEGANDDDVPVLLTDSTAAEAIKLFANTYLAMRVAYFNELDSFALAHGLSSRDVIEGVGLDPRIGQHYNNPSFGYGGYCLPKDTRQLLSTYWSVPQNLIRAIVDANATRKDFIALEVLKRAPRVVGVHGLAMKSGSDNFRSSAVQGVMRRLRDRGVDVVVHDPRVEGEEWDGFPVVRDLADFKERCDVIIANRMAEELADVTEKVYTRDLFGDD
jgi:UDPglucose 6-dehydrogenase